MKTLIVNKKYDNKKLNNFLLTEFPSLSINSIYKALRKKDIRINGKRINENVTLHNNDEITIYIQDDILQGSSPSYSIVFEDNNILVVNKPIGLEVTGKCSLAENLSSVYSYCEPCHRLDRNTCGLVIFAKNVESLKILLEKFKNREIIKHYACLVYGKPPKKNDTLVAYLFKDAKKSLVYIANEPKKGYQKIITSYSVIKYYDNNTTLLDIILHTGRTHQIRAHLSHIGCPIVGDGKYGINEINKKFKAKSQKLCSYSLQFSFSTDAGILNYLNNKIFEIEYNF